MNISPLFLNFSQLEIIMKKSYQQPTFSEKLYGVVAGLIEQYGRGRLARELGLPENYFTPSKYQEKFKGKHTDHLDPILEHLGVDIFTSEQTSVGIAVNSAEVDGALTPDFKEAIYSIIRAARKNAAPSNKERAR